MKMPRLYPLLLLLFLLLPPTHAGAASHYLPVDGVTVHYKTMGAGTDTLFFVHGFSCDTSVWKDQYPAFEDYRIISIDLPGHGMSGSPRIKYTQQRFADAIKAVMDAESVDTALLVVHSMGYQIARKLFDSYPGSVSGISIVDGAYFPVPHDAKARDQFQRELWNFVRITSTNETMDEFLGNMRKDTSSEEISRFFTKLMLSTPVHVRISTMRDFCNLATWKEHPQSVPVQAVYAVTPHLSPANEQYLRTQFPNLEYHQWDGVGHFLMMERPEEFNGLLRSFAQKVYGQ
ncbi:alpha/beta fold hydrolase [Salidesulfovibrio onnuriiensis]|uniref:alpha/beta fold hydrolase n=1 Tax=Salidesulfovibrio onnuriiensis TaxID=2583823 RepID=UPI0011CAD93E|nr:alpha/beta hydrolase [Salidesulfovibrio onnuriiensis]